MLSYLTILIASQAAGQTPLQLTCMGGGTANKPTFSSVSGNSSASGTIGYAPVNLSGRSTTTITGQRQQGFADQVDVRLFSGDDRIRLPRTMLPPIRGGDEGWFKLKGVSADARSIRAKAAVNFMNSPNVHIDRVTGVISISGKVGNYTGQCQAVDPNTRAQF